MGDPRIFLTAQWRYLAVLNYEVDPDVLQPYVPRGTQLDLWDSKAYVSVVGLRFVDTRLLGVPIPFHRDFEEVNLRFYVHRKHADGDRRGVVFIKEYVPRWAVARVARLMYNENYVSIPMQSSVDLENDSLRSGGKVEYRWGGAALRVTSRGSLRPLAPGSKEEFILNHFWGYVSQRDGRSIEYRVDHPVWNVWPLADATLEGPLELLYGERLARYLRTPASASLAEGSLVTVRRGSVLS